MRITRQCHFDGITRPDRTPCNNDPHDACLADQLTAWSSVQHGLHQTVLEFIQLSARITQTGNLNNSTGTDTQPCSSGQGQQIDPFRRDIFPKVAWLNPKLTLIQPIEKLLMDKVDLAQIRPGRINLYPRPMFNRNTRMRIALHTQTGKQVNEGAGEFVKCVRLTEADSADSWKITRHGWQPGLARDTGTSLRPCRPLAFDFKYNMWDVASRFAQMNSFPQNAANFLHRATRSEIRFAH